ncbi:glycosyltransferase [Idiomarina aquatica]|nr:glycosyltransferase [Idiomarina aquatica]
MEIKKFYKLLREKQYQLALDLLSDGKVTQIEGQNKRLKILCNQLLGNGIESLKLDSNPILDSVLAQTVDKSLTSLSGEIIPEEEIYRLIKEYLEYDHEEAIRNIAFDEQKIIKGEFDKFLEEKKQKIEARLDIYEKILNYKFSEYPNRYLTEFPRLKGKKNDSADVTISFLFAFKNRASRAKISFKSLVDSIKNFEKVKKTFKFEIVLVEQSSYDQAYNFFSDKADFVKYERLDFSNREVNKLEMLNHAFHVSSGDILAICDVDYIFEGDFVRKLAERVENSSLAETALAFNCFETHVHKRGGRLAGAGTPEGYFWLLNRDMFLICTNQADFCKHNVAIDVHVKQKLIQHGYRILNGSHAQNDKCIIMRLPHQNRYNHSCDAAISDSNLDKLYDPIKDGGVFSEIKKAVFLTSEIITGEDNMLSDVASYFRKHDVNIIPRVSFTKDEKFDFIITGRDITAFDYIREYIINYDTPVIQVISEEVFRDEFRHTANWISNVFPNLYLLFLNDLFPYENSKGAKVGGVSTFTLSTFDEGLSIADLRKKTVNLKVPFLHDAKVKNLIRRNVRVNNFYSTNRISFRSDTNGFDFPKENSQIYLKNKFYNDNFFYSKSKSEVYNYFDKLDINRNLVAEDISHNLELLLNDQFDFKNQQVVILLDPTCLDQKSGISTYLINMYKFLKLSRLVENIIYFKNPFESSLANNRELFREYVADTFNKYRKYEGNMVFWDSEAHYPGFYLDSCFTKILVTHCSALLAAKLDKKLALPLSKGLNAILKSEIDNIRSADFVISPTLYHDKKQKDFYSDIGKSFVEYESSIITNYVNDSYNKLISYSDRSFDLCFVGRPQLLKGFDKIVSLLDEIYGLKLAILTNSANDMTDKVKNFHNVTLYYDVKADEIIEVLRESKFLIDLSEHHSCSSVLLEAINSKTPAILRDIDTYKEVLKGSRLKELSLFLSDKECQDSKLMASLIKDKISCNQKLFDDEPEKCDKIFNDFLLKNYMENYFFFRSIFSKIGFRHKRYRNSSAFNEYLNGKRVVNVVHSPALEEGDGKFIDSFDCIVRFNRALENIEPMKHGSRTDLLYSCINRSPESGNMIAETYNEFVVDSGAWVAKAYPNLNWTGRFSFDLDFRAGATYDNYSFESFNKAPKRTSEFSREWFEWLEYFMDCRPNTGVLGILDLLQYDISELYLKGYTFFQGGYDFSYRRQNENEVLEYMEKAGYHNQYRQNLLLRKLIMTDARVKYDASLENILVEM